VHVVRRGLGHRREVADEVGVVGAAVGQVGRGQRAARPRSVFALEELLEPRVGRQHLALDGGAAGGGEAGTIDLRDRGRKRRERREERAVLGTGELLGRDDARDPGQDLGGQRESVAQALAHVGDVLVEVPRQVPEPGDVALVVAVLRGLAASCMNSTSAWKPLSLVSGILHSRWLPSASRCVTMKSKRS